MLMIYRALSYLYSKLKSQSLKFPKIKAFRGWRQQELKEYINVITKNIKKGMGFLQE